jgi:chromatin segregation and condensation protein Rec8/ScpA/Scc1 (kleisin family)
MKKTRELVRLGLLPPDAAEEDEELIIPLIRPPFRVTNQRVTLQELLVAMDRVLSRGVRQRAIPTKRQKRTKADPVSFRMEVARANVEENIAQVYEDLGRIMDVDEVVRFVDILVNNTRVEVVRIFFALLHLFARAFIDIWMDEEEEIWIRLLDPPVEEMEMEAEVQLQE